MYLAWALFINTWLDPDKLDLESLFINTWLDPDRLGLESLFIITWLDPERLDLESLFHSDPPKSPGAEKSITCFL